MGEPHRGGNRPSQQQDQWSFGTEAPDFWATAGILWRGRGLVIGITSVGTAIVLGFLVLSLLLPPERSPLPNLYRPAALLLINQDAQENIPQVARGLVGAGLPLFSTSPNFGGLAATLLETKSTIDLIAGEFDLAARYRITKYVRGNVRKAFRARAEFDFDLDTRTLSISYEDYDPVFASAVVNRLVAILEQRFAAIEGDHSRRVRDLLAARYAEVEQQIFRYAERIKQFQQRHGVLDVGTITKEQVTRMAEVGYQLTLKDVQIRTYSEVARINDPALVLLRAERDNLMQLLAEMESGYSQYERVLPAQQEIPDLEIEFAQLRLELAVQTEIYKVLSQQYELAKLEVEGQEPILQVLELADVPDLKAGPSRSQIAIVSFCIALGIAILVALLRHSIRSRMEQPGSERT